MLTVHLECKCGNREQVTSTVRHRPYTKEEFNAITTLKNFTLFGEFDTSVSITCEKCGEVTPVY